ncbi:YceI family protein [Stappia sp. 28M-7]|uniref:YceI family protein n=1 Tax=Stappia sp. 28M-7 TaxID=2762596 RepID=UPI00163CA478|nr:YceI family protein [Stappia sp. 28M-7]MBC2858932.1 YceI family protein [Stappia sp. 28M-7]
MVSLKPVRIAACSALVAVLTVAALPAQAEPRAYRIDPSHFSVVFNAMHIGYAPTWGLFLKGEGSFTYDEETRELSDLSVAIEAGSVFSNDERRDGHLRSGDFLSAEAHPRITFQMTDARPQTDTSGTVTGDLTLRGVTRPVTLDVTLNKIGPYPFGGTYVIGISASTVLKRSDFGMTYAVADGLVGDEVSIRIDLEAIRQ